MKNTGRCPKCESTDLVRIPAGGWALTPIGFAPTNQLGGTSASAPVTHYLCAGCGFVEQWIEDGLGVRQLRRKYGSPPHDSD